jgi:hypothetical protein
MTRSEYIRRAKEAIAVGISDKRWGYAAEHGELPEDAEGCGLCALDEMLEEETENYIHSPCYCPVQYAVELDEECEGHSGCCCKEWLQWRDVSLGTAEAKAAARAMIARLQSLDVEGCADALVRDGVLEAGNEM